MIYTEQNLQDLKKDDVMDIYDDVDEDDGEEDDEREPEFYYWFTQDSWLDGDSPSSSLSFPGDIERDEFEELMGKNHPNVIDCEFGIGRHTDAVWYTFDPDLGYEGFQKILDGL